MVLPSKWIIFEMNIKCEITITFLVEKISLNLQDTKKRRYAKKISLYHLVVERKMAVRLDARKKNENIDVTALNVLSLELPYNLLFFIFCWFFVWRPVDPVDISDQRERSTNIKAQVVVFFVLFWWPKMAKLAPSEGVSGRLPDRSSDRIVGSSDVRWRRIDERRIDGRRMTSDHGHLCPKVHHSWPKRDWFP